MVKAGDTPPSVPTSPGQGQPSNFPKSPAGGRPVDVTRYPIAPKGSPRLGAAANPGGAGNGGGDPEFDDNKPSSKKEQPQTLESVDHQYQLMKINQV